jgi:chitinase
MPSARSFLALFVGPALAAATGLVAALVGVASAAPAADGPKVFLGYISREIDEVNYSLYTHLCHAFVTAEADGRLKPDRFVPDRELTRRAHEAGVQVLLSLGGWSEVDVFAAIVQDRAAEDRYVAAVLAMVKEYEYDGIDLDWEYPDGDDEVEGFERLATRLREGLDALAAERGKPLLLTMAVSAHKNTLKWLKPEFMLDTFDWLHVMTYDYASTTWSSHANHNSPLFASSKQPLGSPSIAWTMEYLLEDRGYPPQRLVLGLPLYGRGFAVAEPYAPKPEKPKPEHPYAFHSTITELLNSGWTRRWDDETKTPWLLAPNRSEVIGYDDVESLSGKTRWANEHHLRGVFFWEILQDREEGANPVQEAVHHVWAEGEAAQLP